MEKNSGIRILILGAFITGISLFHYLTPLHVAYLHDIFQRLYYLPIILAALWFGLRGGLLCSVLVSLVYAPHILFQWGAHFGMETEKYLEIILYNAVGAVTGLLSQRERERTVELQKSTRVLEASYEKLRAQSERIIAIEEQLRRSERLSTMGEFAAVLAHEIRNPLGSIRGTAEILKDDYKPGDPKHEFIEIQIRETERLNRVVEEFLHMVRPQPSEMQPCAVHDELETIVTLLSGDASKRQVELVLQPQQRPVIIRADGEKLRQAFLNILLNALQATPTGGRVEISATDDGNGACEITFRDTGTGIDAEDLDRIFEPFFTTKTDGTGLGLAISRKIVETHKGALKVESRPGEGTIVRITLPMQGGVNGELS
ncbi:MAG TPA: ATP-binding protein [Chlorobaculum sp.]|nr:ATP-binding protein [Chlorobaculum sp.]